MGRKLGDISNIVKNSPENFIEYLKNNLNPLIYLKLQELQFQTDVIIFSGIIRNFFLNINENRDIDLVLKEKIDIETIFKNYQINKNSFNGYKILLDGFNIDIWFLKDTWAFQNQKNLGFELDKYIPSTSFFNFSSICFLWKEKEFVFTKDFIWFLKYKKINVVYKPNSNYALCVVNSIYYSKKYNLKITENLRQYLKHLHNSGIMKYKDVQLNHFGEVLYSDEDINNFFNAKNEK